MGPSQGDGEYRQRGKIRVHACMCIGSGHDVGEETRGTVVEDGYLFLARYTVGRGEKGLSAGVLSGRERLSVVEERDRTMIF